MPPVFILPAAQKDLFDQADYYDSQGGETLGDRFLARCEAGFERIAAFPESGTRVRLRHPNLEGCRFILAPEFDRILIFYRLGEGKSKSSASSMAPAISKQPLMRTATKPSIENALVPANGAR